MLVIFFCLKVELSQFPLSFSSFHISFMKSDIEANWGKEKGKSLVHVEVINSACEF